MPGMGLGVKEGRVCGARVRSGSQGDAQRVGRMDRGEVRCIRVTSSRGQEGKDKRMTGRGQRPSPVDTRQGYENELVVVCALACVVTQGQGGRLEHQATQGTEVLQQIPDHDLFERPVEATAG